MVISTLIIQIIPLADLHIGDAQCDLALINRTINYIKNTPNAFTIVNGDIINAIKVSKSNTAKMQPSIMSR